MKAITQPILGNKLTPEQREAIRDEYAKAVWALAESVKRDIAEHGETLFEWLTDSEVLDLSRGGMQLFRLARCIMCATYPERLPSQFAVESIVKDIKRTKRILKGRQ